MRSRLVIPAAILVAVAYVKGRQDAFLLAPAAPPAPGPTPEAIRRAEAEAADAWEIGVAQAEVAATIAPPEPAASDQVDLSAIAEWLAAPSPVGRAPRHADDDPAVLSEWSTVPVTPVRVPAAPGDDPALLNEWLSQPARLSAEPVAPAAHEGLESEIDESGRFSLGGWAAQPGHMALSGITFRRRREGPVEPSRIRLVIEAAQNVVGEGLVVLSDAGFAPDREGFTVLLAAGGPGRLRGVRTLRRPPVAGPGAQPSGAAADSQKRPPGGRRLPDRGALPPRQGGRGTCPQ